MTEGQELKPTAAESQEPSGIEPRTKRDWRTLGSFAAFIVALFVEMYGFPRTIYLLSGWLAHRFPGIDPLGHDAGHLWYTLLGFKGNPHFNPIHIASNAVIVLGFWLLGSSWHALYRAQRHKELATASFAAFGYVVFRDLRDRLRPGTEGTQVNDE